MKELLKKAAFIGIGLAYMTKEKIEEVAGKIIEESKLSEEEGKKFAKELLKQSEEAKKHIEEKVEERVRQYLAKIDIPTREEIGKLENRIKKLEKTSHKHKDTK